MSIKQSLLEIGFPSEKIDLAISNCGENLELATEWLLAHPDEIPTTPHKESVNSGEENGSSEGNDTTFCSEEQEVKSFQCDDCKKLFKSSEEVEYHAVKSGHSSFSESTEEKKPLTEEQRQIKLKELEAKLSQRRKEREHEERKEMLEKERKRIQMGKDMAEMKQKMKDQEIKKLAEERKREKMEDKLARQRVREEIERDRQARKESAALSSKKECSSTSHSNQTSLTSTLSTASQVIRKSYDSTKLQIRLPSGPPIVHEFNAKEPLSAVRLWVSLNRSDDMSDGSSALPFSLSTTFPRKIFTEEDMDKPLNSLGLVPSAVLVVTNK